MNQIGSVVKSPYNIVVMTSVIFMVYLTLIPLGQMIIQTFTLVGADAARVDGGRERMLTPYYWKRVLTSSIPQKMLRTPLENSLSISVCTAALGITLGSLLTRLMVRSDLPYKRFFSLAPITPRMILSRCRPMVWLATFRGERVDGAQGLLGFSGIQTPGWLVYEPFVIITVLVIHYHVHAYLLVFPVLSSINSGLGEMGEILGASKARILIKITFPLVIPTILSAAIVIFSKAMGTFGVPSVLGLKIGHYTVSTTTYSSMQNGQNWVASAISLTLIAITSFSVFSNQKTIGSRKSFSTIGGEGSRDNPIRLGRWRPVIVGILTAFIIVTVVFPVVTLLYQSFILEPGSYSLSSFTLHYWTGDPVPTTDQGEPGISKSPQFMKYMVNTIKLVVLISLFATMFGQLIGHINPRERRLLSEKLMEQPIFMPYLIPSIALGAMYLALFATAKKIEMLGYRVTLVPSLYGFSALLVLIATVRNIPSASRAGASSILQISTELEGATQAENAGFLYGFSKIVFLLSKGDMISGFTPMSISIMEELDLIAILITPGQQTPPYIAYACSAESLIQLSSAMTTVMFVLVFFVYWLTNTLTDADITKGF